jgi:hypothetical protein
MTFWCGSGSADPFLINGSGSGSRWPKNICFDHCCGSAAVRTISATDPTFYRIRISGSRPFITLKVEFLNIFFLFFFFQIFCLIFFAFRWMDRCCKLSFSGDATLEPEGKPSNHCAAAAGRLRREDNSARRRQSEMEPSGTNSCCSSLYSRYSIHTRLVPQNQVPFSRSQLPS